MEEDGGIGSGADSTCEILFYEAVFISDLSVFEVHPQL